MNRIPTTTDGPQKIEICRCGHSATLFQDQQESIWTYFVGCLACTTEGRYQREAKWAIAHWNFGHYEPPINVQSPAGRVAIDLAELTP